jgi:hypothetical protein
MTRVRLLSVFLIGAAASAGAGAVVQSGDPGYNGRFTFTRIRYGYDGEMGRSRRGGGSAWAHDWPDADRNMQLILKEVTVMDVNLERSNVFDLEDPAIFQHPVIYISEPGSWAVSDVGAENLRTFLMKGGFLILDDFEDTGYQWPNVQEQLRRVLPDGEIVELPFTHKVFDSFFHMDKIDVPHPLVRVEPIYLGIFEDNDPTKRLMVMLNLNSDLAEYWEYAGTGYFPMDLTNDAWRLGVNYIIYGLTH